ncbi:MAG TPA: hypothetical protein VI997_11025, partial [Candidatus Thermoplasmatota archaeon]|nr:hypothetical protein [Candidatus Thermoplasmatota archaeon]
MRVGILAVMAILAGCLSAPDPGPAPAPDAKVPPLADVPGAVRSLTLVASLPHPLLNDLAFRPGFVYASSHTAGTVIYDVSDPTAPAELSVVPCNGIDVGVVDLASGRRIMTISHSGDDGCPDAVPGGGIRVVDVTDPAEPVVLGQARVEGGSHSHTTWGDTGLVINSQIAQSPLST